MLEGSRLSSRGMPNALCRMFWTPWAPATIVTAFGNNCSPNVVRDFFLVAVDRDAQDAEIVALCPLVFDRYGEHLAR